MNSPENSAPAQTPDAGAAHLETGPPDPPLMRIAPFAIATTMFVAAAIILFLLIFRLESLSAGWHLRLALFLGVAGTIGVAVALMALVFHSNRSGHDDRIGQSDD